jgi:hypothetical protein
VPLALPVPRCRSTFRFVAGEAAAWHVGETVAVSHEFGHLHELPVIHGLADEPIV